LARAEHSCLKGTFNGKEDHARKTPVKEHGEQSRSTTGDGKGVENGHSIDGWPHRVGAICCGQTRPSQIEWPFGQ
jgi:hypothetical protein